VPGCRTDTDSPTAIADPPHHSAPPGSRLKTEKSRKTDFYLYVLLGKHGVSTKMPRLLLC
jgi:hypothetical protein